MRHAVEDGRVHEDKAGVAGIDIGPEAGFGGKLFVKLISIVVICQW